jgi:hypothetical protein
MNSPSHSAELRIRIGADGRIECRSSPGDDAPTLGFDPAFFGSPDSDGARRALGAFVFSLLQGLSPVQQTAARNAPDGAAALYDDFVTLQNRAMKEYSSSLLAMAEQSLQQSAAAGFAKAIDAMKDWPSVRTVADMLIARGPEQPR